MQLLARRHHSRAVLGLLGLFLSAWLAMPATASADAPTEPEVKAVFVYNFGKFVKWPESEYSDETRTERPFVIGVLGEDPVGDALDRLVANHVVQGRHVSVSRFASMKDYLPCDILFIASSETGDLKTILKSVQGSSTLTVSDVPHFTERGGMFGFQTENSRVRFEVNLGSAQSAGLTVSSQLLKLARNVIGQRKAEQ